MLTSCPIFILESYIFLSVAVKVGVLKALPDVFDSKWRRMNHVVSIETVVTKFVEHNLVRRKILRYGVVNRCVDNSIFFADNFN